jgi:hypothetical protein
MIAGAVESNMREARPLSLPLLLALALGACGGATEETAAITATAEDDGHEEAPAAEAEESPEEPEVEVAEAAEAEDAVEAGPVVEDPSFELRAVAADAYATGEEGSFEIRLEPRGIYHVNMEYPMSIELSGAQVEVPARVDRAAAAEYTEERARFEIPVTPGEGEGERRVTAEVDFAVCTPEACMPERRTVAVVLPMGDSDA